ncbi:MAG: DUF1223 domain-containing protein [Thiotrichales bacterium]|nr:MAG: DUF1223 domain-containing protein [Thiotrichales bacterium]
MLKYKNIRFAGLILLCLTGFQPLAESRSVLTAYSPAHRVAMLELYTSEGCSSCPPADRFMRELRRAEVSELRMIPLAFHVTYWDKLGWSDRFADKRFDDRQRMQVRLGESRTVYTPQYMLNGRDFRDYKSLYIDINRTNQQAAPYQLKLSVVPDTDSIAVGLDVTSVKQDDGTAVAYIAMYEHDLGSDVTEGENEGEQLKHDYVVRDLKGPFPIDNAQATITAEFTTTDYKINDTGIVAFVQRSRAPDILQVVRLELEQ